MTIELNFEKISKTVKNSTAKPQNSEKFNSKTSKLQPENLPETSRQTASVYIKGQPTL